MARSGLPKKYAKMGFKKGWRAYKASKRKPRRRRVAKVARRRRRRKKPKRRYRRKIGAKAYARRRKPMGLLGKAGLFVGAVFPTGWAIMDGGSAFWNTFQSGQYGPFESIKLGMASFVDSLTCGFTGIKVMNQLSLRDVNGGAQTVQTMASAPAGAWGYTTAVGVGMVLLDRIISKYLMKRSTKSLFGIKVLGG
jgi:hypothetical protein